eukprot:COSAG06_NODE_29242_length_560_cov_0.785249_1_plen_109_part_10
MIAGDRSGGGEQGGGGGGEPCPGWTAIHGDFHRGNLFYLPPPDLATATATTADHEDGDTCHLLMQNNHFPRQARDKVNCFQLNTTQQTAFCAGCNGREAIGRSSGSHHR